CWSVKGPLISPQRPEEARILTKQAIEVVVAHELPRLLGGMLANLSELDLQRDRYSDSLRGLEQLLEFARRTGNRRNELFALSEMTYALTMLGDWAEALEQMAEIPDEVVGRVSTLTSPLSGVLQIHLSRGNVEEARRLLARFDDLGRSADIQD